MSPSVEGASLPAAAFAGNVGIESSEDVDTGLLADSVEKVVGDGVKVDLPLSSCAKGVSNVGVGSADLEAVLSETITGGGVRLELGTTLDGDTG